MVVLWACSYLNSSFVNVNQRIACLVEDFLFSLHHCEIKYFFSLSYCCALSSSFFLLFNAILTSASVSLMIYPRSAPSLFNVRHKQSILFWENTAVKSWLKKKSKLCLFCVILVVTELGQNWTILSFFHIFKVTWAFYFGREQLMSIAMVTIWRHYAECCLALLVSP